MIYPFWRWALLLTALFLLPILLICAQPYDDGGLRDFLTPPQDCPAPCFMGIRPGVTTAEEAIAILEEHEWVASVGEDVVKLMQEVSEEPVPPVIATIDWAWNGSQPAWIDSAIDPGFIDSAREVSAIVIRTHIPLGEVLSAYGIPDNAHLIWTNNEWFGHQFSYDVWYSTKCVCPGWCSWAAARYLPPTCRDMVSGAST